MWTPRTGALGSYTIASQALNDRMNVGVNVANGNLLVSNHDLDIAGTDGADAIQDRTFNSLADSGSIGDGFGERTTGGLSRDVYLQSFVNGDIAFHRGDGAIVPFLKTGDAGGTTSFNQPTNLNATLIRDDASGVYTMTYVRTGAVWSFDSSGKLTSLKDKDNNTISIDYFADGKAPASIIDTQGRTITLTRNDSTDNYLTSMADSSSRTWEYAYGGATGDDLTDYTDPAGNHTLYDYDSNDRITQITTPGGNVTKIAYDGTGRVTSIIRTTDTGHTTGPTTTFSYGSGAPCTSGQLKTVLTDPNSHATTYCADTKDRVVKVRDALNRDRDQSYTPNGDVASFTDLAGTAFPSNTTLSHASDGTNDLTGGSEPEGETFGISYFAATDPISDSGGGPLVAYRPKRFTDEQNSQRNYTYNSRGDLTSVVDAVGRNKATMARNADGTLASATDGNGHQTTFSYDAHGNLTGVTPPAAGTVLGSALAATTSTVDGLSRVHTITDGKGTQTYTYDPLDRLTRVDLSDGTFWTFAYNADGNLIERSNSSAQTTSYTYDALNRRLTETFPGAVTNIYSYDAGGNLKTITDGSGTVTYSYDAVNRVSSIVSPTAVGTSTDTVSYGYDDTGSTNTRRETLTFPGGATEEFTRDRSGKLIKVIAKSATGTVLSSRMYSYDQTAGTTIVHTTQVQSVTDESNNRTAYTYKDANTGDDVGRVWQARTTNSSGGLVSQYNYSYDAVGNRTAKVKQTGTTTTTTYAYNNDNQLCWSVSGTSSNTCANPPVGATSYTYDADGNQLTGGIGGPETYDILDHLTGLGGMTLTYRSPSNVELSAFGTTVLRDNLLGPSAETIGGTTTTFVRDPAGQAISQRSSDGKQYLLTDNIGSTTGLLDPSSGTIVRSYSYDPDGNATSVGTGAMTDLQFGDGQVVGGLYHLGQRYYDPATARWTQQDPIVQPGALTQANRYIYAADDPINRMDPTGDLSFKTLIKAYSLVETATYTVASGVAAVVGTATCIGATEGLASAACAGIAASAGSAFAGGVYATYREAKDF